MPSTITLGNPLEIHQSHILKAGGSRYPYELVQEAGVDLATPAPYQALVVHMNNIMDQIESILAKGKRPSD